MKVYSDSNEGGYSVKDENYTLKILVTENEAVTLNDRVNLIREEFDINVEQIKYDADSGREKIGLKLLANDTDFDLFCIDTTYIDYYAKNNAVYDLSKEAQIVINFDNMFAGIKDLCFSNNILCGVPLSINQSQCLWKCNSELMKKLNFSIPLQKMTWIEFCELSQRLKKEANDLGINDFKVFSQNGMNVQLVEYMSNYLDYVNQTTIDCRDEYSSFLNTYINMVDEGIISETYDPGNSLFTIGGSFDYFANDEYVFPEPLFSHESSYVIGITILAVNPNSNHTEKAVEYLTAASSVSVLKKAAFTYLLKDREMYEYTDRNGNRQELSDNTGGHSVLAFVISNSTRQYFNKDIFGQVQEYVTKMRNRSISTDEFSNFGDSPPFRGILLGSAFPKPCKYQLIIKRHHRDTAGSCNFIYSCQLFLRSQSRKDLLFLFWRGGSSSSSLSSGMNQRRSSGLSCSSFCSCPGVASSCCTVGGATGWAS